MKTAKSWGYLIIAWVGLCLILFLAACSTLQKTNDGVRSYRVAVILQAGEDAGLSDALANIPATRVEYGPPVDTGLGRAQQTVSLTLPDAKTVGLFREQLQRNGNVIIGFAAEKKY